MKSFRVRKTDLFLRGMDVDIESVRFNFQKEYKCRVMPLCQERAISIHDCMKHGCIADGPPVHKQFLRCFRGPRMESINHYATDRHSCYPTPHLNSPVEKGRAVDLKDSITIRCHG